MFDFAIIYPVWVLVSEDSVVRNEHGVPIDMVDRPGFDIATEGHQRRLLAFSDDDLADRWIARATKKWVKWPIKSQDRFIHWLRVFAAGGVTHVLFDPEGVGTLYWIQSVIQALERRPS
jgi:hypothetical protein